MSSNSAKHDSRPDRAFDGHLEIPIEQMTPKQRLQHAWQGTLMLHWARRARIDSGRALPEDVEREPET